MSAAPHSRSDSRVREIASVAVFAALIVALTLFPAIEIGISPVPITLQTFAVTLTAMLLGPRRGSLAVLTYLALIAIGLPVAAGYVGGLGVFAGPTGGFLVGFVPQALLVGAAATWATHRKVSTLRLLLAGLAGIPVVYAVGTAWLMVVTGMALGPALAAAVAPFVIGDLLKTTIAAIVAAGALRALPDLRRS